MPTTLFARLTKTAATRAAKEYRAEAARQGVQLPRKLVPGQTLSETVRMGLPNATATSLAPGGQYARLGELERGLQYNGSFGNAGYMAENRANNLAYWAGMYGSPRVNPTSPGPSVFSGEGPAQVQRALKDRFSGRHAGRPGETLIPAGGVVNLTAGKPSPNYLFRGNTPGIIPNGWVTDAQGTPGILMSRHPDVAASYATAQTRGSQSPATGRLFAFRNDLPGGWGPDAPDTNLTSDPAMTGTTLAKRKARQQRFNTPRTGKPFRHLPGAGFNGRFEPHTFEDLVPNSAADFNNPVGEYSARASRMPDGTPAFALKDVKGQPASKVFPGAVQVPDATQIQGLRGLVAPWFKKIRPRR